MYSTLVPNYQNKTRKILNDLGSGSQCSLILLQWLCVDESFAASDYEIVSNSEFFRFLRYALLPVLSIPRLRVARNIIGNCLPTAKVLKNSVFEYSSYLRVRNSNAGTFSS